MDHRFIVTISRQFGSLGRPIAIKLSELLGVNFYDRDIVEMTAKNLGMPVSEIKKHEESVGSGEYLRMMFPLGRSATETQDMIFNEQTRIIRDIADRESCIIVGRCSDFILGNEKNAMHIFIYAPYEDRLRNSIDVLRMGKDEAEKMIKKVDRARKAYHLHYAGYAPEDLLHHDLLLNSSLLGINGSAESLYQTIKIRFGLDDKEDA
ncbi:MAG: cytidylate kinase-like family protein [Lachnospiraceae bacterium]|nr:cytidylate kinase-like family protein [Lachnospiraceae bacterium]MDY6351808.1 cytidylate kinase-like family protein [Lachnospiraceae bacterium]